MSAIGERIEVAAVFLVKDVSQALAASRRIGGDLGRDRAYAAWRNLEPGLRRCLAEFRPFQRVDPREQRGILAQRGQERLNRLRRPPYLDQHTSRVVSDGYPGR